MLFSARKNKAARRREDPKTMWRHALYGTVLFVCIAILVVALWYGTRLPSLTITEITVEGGETISHEDVRVRVEEVLRGDYLRIIPYRFSLLYPHDIILNSLATIPRMYDIAIVRKDLQTLLVTFREFLPQALWCTPNTESTECFFLDDQGFAFSPSPMLTGGSFIRHIFADRETLEVGSVMSPEEFSRIQLFLERIQEELSLRITDVLHTKEGDLFLRINGGGEIRIAQDDSFDRVFANLSSVLESESFTHLEPGNFQYIDLRFGNKVFVNEELPSENVGTTTDDGVATSTDM